MTNGDSTSPLSAEAPEEPALSDSETLRLELLKERIRATFPGLFPILRGLIDAGLIRGLRDLEYLGPPRPEPRNAVNAGQMALNEYRLEDDPKIVPLMRNRYK